MGKTARTSMILSLDAGLELLAAVGSAEAQDNPCQGKAEHRLQEYGLTRSDPNDVEWIERRSGHRQDGPVASYHMWSTPKELCRRQPGDRYDQRVLHHHRVHPGRLQRRGRRFVLTGCRDRQNCRGALFRMDDKRQAI